MSRLFFIPSIHPLVKMNGIEKIELCRKPAKIIMSTVIKYHSIFNPVFPVKNPCGKTCGECGKPKVINRYFGFLPFYSLFLFPIFCGIFPPSGIVIISDYVTGFTATLSVRLSRKSWSCKQIARFLV